MLNDDDDDDDNNDDADDDKTKESRFSCKSKRCNLSHDQFYFAWQLER